MLQEEINARQIKRRFQKALSEIYSEKEISSLCQIAFEHEMKWSKTDLILKQDVVINPKQISRFDYIITELLKEKPIQYIFSKCEFYGIPLQLNADVLIPRPETEELVQWILKSVHIKRPYILDLATGSGCIALALKTHIPGAQVSALDVSTKALALASINAIANHCEINFFQFDLLRQQSLGFMQFDIMVSNPPYILETDRSLMSKNVLDYEPHKALFVTDEEPLVFYRRILDLADGNLKSQGHLYFEINEKFGAETATLLQDRGYNKVEIRKDLQGKDRMAKAVKA